METRNQIYHQHKQSTIGSSSITCKLNDWNRRRCIYRNKDPLMQRCTELHPTGNNRYLTTTQKQFLASRRFVIMLKNQSAHTKISKYFCSQQNRVQYNIICVYIQFEWVTSICSDNTRIDNVCWECQTFSRDGNYNISCICMCNTIGCHTVVNVARLVDRRINVFIVNIKIGCKLAVTSHIPKHTNCFLVDIFTRPDDVFLYE